MFMCYIINRKIGGIMKKKTKLFILFGLICLLGLVMTFNLSYADSGWDSNYGGNYAGGYSSSSSYDNNSGYEYDDHSNGSGNAILYLLLFIVLSVSFITSQVMLAIHRKNIREINKQLDSLNDMEENEIHKYIFDSKDSIKEITLNLFKEFINNNYNVCTESMLESKVNLDVKEIIEVADNNVISVNDKQDVVIYLVYKYIPKSKKVKDGLFEQLKIFYVKDGKSWKIDKIERL